MIYRHFILGTPSQNILKVLHTGSKMASKVHASGVAAVLELARILSKVDLRNDIQYVLFSGEEQGQWGSTAYVKHLQPNNTKVDLIMNLDMIGYPALGLDNVSIEYDLGNKFTTNDIYSKKVGQFIEQVALDYANLETSLHPLGMTDLNPSDTLDTLDMEYLTSVTKLVLAAILNIDELSLY